jgi:hypothetical protein
MSEWPEDVQQKDYFTDNAATATYLVFFQLFVE